MARERRKRGSEHLPEPDTLPLMNIIFMLILSLLTMASMLPLGFITSEAQKLSSGEGSMAPTPENKNPLNLIVFITESGFNFSVQNLVKTGSVDPNNASRKLALVPKKPLPGGGSEYDYAALKEKLLEYKKLDPLEESMTLTADPEIAFDVIIQTMDASRFEADRKALFPKVSFAAGMVG